MNRDIAAGNWKALKGRIKEHWGKLTADDLTRIAGRRDRLIGVVQRRYGVAKDEARRWLRSLERRH
jgi:uncharacterized protein YjbJ (UPF0337 family)